MQIKTAIRYQWSEWPSLESLQIINAGEGMEKEKALTLLWECKLVQLLWKTVWNFLIK